MNVVLPVNNLPYPYICDSVILYRYHKIHKHSKTRHIKCDKENFSKIIIDIIIEDFCNGLELSETDPSSEDYNKFIKKFKYGRNGEDVLEYYERYNDIIIIKTKTYVVQTENTDITYKGGIHIVRFDDIVQSYNTKTASEIPSMFTITDDVGGFYLDKINLFKPFDTSFRYELLFKYISLTDITDTFDKLMDLGIKDKVTIASVMYNKLDTVSKYFKI